MKLPACTGSTEKKKTLLRSLNGSEQSMLEVTVSSDGTLHIYEAYSQQETEQLVERLKAMGVKVRVLSSSPCG